MSPTAGKPSIHLKRAYEPPAAADGTRILVDRLWPRGVRKLDLAIDRWLKEVAPSAELRRWFGHDPARWAEFRRRYAGRVTLVYAARDEAHNHAVLLRELLAGEGA